MKQHFEDCLGVPFDEHALWLPPRTADWPSPKHITLKATLSNWRMEWAGTPCWWCGCDTNDFIGDSRGELNHLRSGTGQKKIEEVWLYTWLCHRCHQSDGVAVKSESLGRLLYLKWLHDAEHTYWQGIALRLRRRLPDLITN